MRKFIIGLSLLAVIGCGSTPMNVIMRNPETGKSVYVSHYSYGFGLKGIMGAIAAQQQQDKAVEAAKLMGYTEMEIVK